MAALAIWLAAPAAGLPPLFAGGAAELDPELKLERTRGPGPFHVQPYFRVQHAPHPDHNIL